MIPGQIFVKPGDIVLNAGRKTIILTVQNNGNRPIQIGSHFHFYEVNSALEFERQSTKGFRLDIPAGTSIRFSPGETRTVCLVTFGGRRVILGFTGQFNGPLEE
ncbi:urease subunit beta [SAR202 cluster bacterium AD-804-J14_MRT_500m]|nr:urease subunit beta [SAR202 cluster bacterium AD-804-J14_MRT_500m]